MKPEFDPFAFCARLGRDLVQAFDAAGEATTPGLVGAAREQALRDQLGKLMPRGLAVGTGCVIDTDQATSSQQDIVIYERDLCPVFSLGDAGASYFPCEGVAAVGEVKSRLGTEEFGDALAKVRSAKRLRRRSLTSDGLVGPSAPFRGYGSTSTIQGTPSEGFDQNANVLDQIYGFVLYGTLGVAPQRICDQLAESLRSTERAENPNLVVGLADGIAVYATSAGAWTWDPAAAASVVFLQSSHPFVDLLLGLSAFVRTGRTVPDVAFNHYLADPGTARGDVLGIASVDDPD